MKKIFLLLTLFLFGCDFDFQNNNLSRIEVSPEISKRLEEIINSNPSISAELLYQSKVKKNQLGSFHHLDNASTGLDFIHKWEPKPKHKDQLNNSFIAAGVAVGDIDNDGLPDVFLSRQADGGRLYKNLGNFRFEDITLKSGIKSDEMWSTGVTFADVNNDGWLDIFICGFDSPNRLYINQKTSFKESAEEYGLNYKGASVVMSFSDFDLDGDLDAYLLTNRLENTGATSKAKIIKNKNKSLQVHPDSRELGYFVRPPGRMPLLINAGQYDYLYRNDNGRFVDITVESGIGKNPYYGLSSTWWDYNNDGWPDLYVANDYMGPDHLFRNEGLDTNGNIKFIDVIEEAVPYTPWFSMGSDYSDINNDGKIDFLASDMAGSNHYRDKVSMGSMSGPDSDAWFLNFPNPPQYMRNALYLNTGTTRFMEVAYLTGLAATDWTWTVKFGDLDNDGFEDVYFTNGMSRDFVNGDLKDRFKKILKDGENSISEFELWENEKPYQLKNMVYKNLGNLKFKDVSQSWNLDHLGVSTGSAIGDLDGDGDLDMVVNGFKEKVRVYRNDLSQNNILRLRLRGEDSNIYGLGSKIIVTLPNGDLMTRYLSSSRGFMSSSEPVVHFGLGQFLKAKKVSIYWPSGQIQILEDIPAGYVYTISEQSNSGKEDRRNKPMFTKGQSTLAKIKHSERIFDDFKRENLLPNKLSQLGPGISWGDIDNDNDNDVYIGGASGYPGRIFVNNGNSEFIMKYQSSFLGDKNFEDMGVLFIDVDEDGDLDLFVASGGVECVPGSSLLLDRIYLNDGLGNFTKGHSSLLPDIRTSSSVVAAADIDLDGTQEIFIGGRVVPGKYPLSPNSFIIKKIGSNYSDATTKLAPEIKNAGMVTSAIFSDVDIDGWPDLLVTYEWGPVRFFHNDSGFLYDRTADVDMAERLGWFNSISGGDIDNDGDIDFVLGNTGYNTKYKATADNPEILFYGDFEGNGDRHIVEAKYEKDVCFPRRGLSCSSGAMPTIKEKFPTYHDFAISSVQDIYTDDLLSSAEKFEANELASGILINKTDSEGSISFDFVPLPRIVQASPVFGSAICDVDGDGNLDIYVVQNFSGPQRETGYMHGGVSHLLMGDGKSNFTPIDPSVSGLLVSGDAKSLTTHDLNQDGRVDLFIGVNNGNLQSYINDTDSESIALNITKYNQGTAYNGAKVRVYYEDNSIQMHEIVAGGGYLSQSAPLVFIGNKNNIKHISITWPDGTEDQVSDYKSLNGLSSL